MKELEKVKKQFREMVAYCMDTKDSEVIYNYTETFLEIYKEGIAKLEKERDELKSENKKWKEDNDVWMKTSLSDITEENARLEQELQTLKDAVREYRKFRHSVNSTTCPSLSQFENLKKSDNKLKELLTPKE